MNEMLWVAVAITVVTIFGVWWFDREKKWGLPWWAYLVIALVAFALASGAVYLVDALGRALAS